MAALIGPVNNFAMTRVLTFTAHWDIFHLTPGAISTALRVAKLCIILTLILFNTFNYIFFRTKQSHFSICFASQALQKAFSKT